MINHEDFIKRLEIILEYYGVNASSFADNIGVQRSSLSHLLSGRNKPSLDFILKILEVYPEVDLYWILNGKGTFPKSDYKIDNEIPASSSKSSRQFTAPKLERQLDVFEEKIIETKSEENEIDSDLKNQINIQQKSNIEIDRIVIFYKNGTFNTYSPE
ncbi:helix-turn-helix domain-containing protein [Flavobacterium cellulosilyticum]|uniref:XRE family transcriptional regulator n=1 Tax=Flavobacterium cellulosilyticum TaxID=2541731 RepID=A0A4R5C4M0_9FLAO|nr:helix-turn-helix transcriptional regulator [Flavobacterium cellulosilyticum]TDD93915.1 XRE family transcriptional regulator [Flavobacterium cellulosilyticum]